MVLVPPVGVLVAACTYLRAELDARGNALPLGVSPPPGPPQPYGLITRPGGAARGYLGDYMVQVSVFDTDVIRLERNADLMWRLLLSAGHTKIDTSEGSVWITGATNSSAPYGVDDPDVPMFGMRMSVFWTIGLRPERPAATRELW